MTPERLAEIRERVLQNEEDRTEFFKPQPIEVDLVSLLAEVERLRAGIEALATEWSRPSPYDGHGMRAPIDPDHAARRLTALLEGRES